MLVFSFVGGKVGRKLGVGQGAGVNAHDADQPVHWLNAVLPTSDAQAAAAVACQRAGDAPRVLLLVIHPYVHAGIGSVPQDNPIPRVGREHAGKGILRAFHAVVVEAVISVCRAPHPVELPIAIVVVADDAGVLFSMAAQFCPRLQRDLGRAVKRGPPGNIEASLAAGPRETKCPITKRTRIGIIRHLGRGYLRRVVAATA